MFDAVRADSPHPVAVLVNNYLFCEIDEADEMIADMEYELAKLRAFRTAYPDLKKRAA